MQLASLVGAIVVLRTAHKEHEFLSDEDASQSGAVLPGSRPAGVVCSRRSPRSA